MKRNILSVKKLTKRNQITVLKCVVISFLFIGLVSQGLAQNFEWEKNLGGSARDRARSIIQTSDGGFAIAGFSRSSDNDVGGNNGRLDIWVIKLDNAGTIQWEKNLGGSATDFANSIIQTSDGGFAIAGSSYSSDGDVGGNNGVNDAWVVKLDNAGTIQWEKNLGGSATDYATSIVQTSDNGFAVAGYSKSSDGDVGGNKGRLDMWVMKLDNTGAIQWEKNFGGSDNDRANSIVQTSDNGFAIAGHSRSSDGDVGGNNGIDDYWVVKLNNAGALQWEKHIGGSSVDKAKSIVQTSDNGFAIAGHSRSSDGDVGSNNGNDDYWVVKLDNTGSIQWEKNLGGSEFDQASSIVQTSDGGFAIAGFSESSDGDVGGNNGIDDYWVVKLDNAGAVQWEKNLGGNDSDQARSIVQTSDGGFAIAGRSLSSDGDVSGNYGERDYWVVNLSCGPATVTIDTTVCKAYEVPSGDTTYTKVGTYVNIQENATPNGCDSITTINLTIAKTVSSINRSVCNKYEVPSGDETYTQGGTYTDTLENANSEGCDSIITINLTISDVDSSVNKAGDTLKANTSGATYQWLDCENGYAEVSGATSQTFTPSSDGNYAVAVTKNNCTDTSSCYQVKTTGIGSNSSKANFEVYPNPATDQLTIVHPDNLKPKTFKLQNLTGQRIQNGKFSGTKTLDISDLSPGVYLLQVQSEDAVKKKKVVVE